MKVAVSSVVGVPEMTPVPDARLKPTGKDPDARSQVYGRSPPVASTVSLYENPTYPPGMDVVVMVSAVNQKEKLAECIRAGAIDFIIKPFEKADLRRFFEKNLAAEG